MFKKILVPIDVDHPETAKAVYQNAADIAKHSGGEIRLISVLPGFGMPLVASYISNDIRKEIFDRLKTSLEAFIRNNCDEPVSYKIATGKNWEEILKAADKWEADLIMVYYDKRRDINEVHSGSCARRIAEDAGCSVLWMRNIFN